MVRYSSTFAKRFGIELTAKNKTLLYVPVGFAHGFAALSDYCEVQYKQTGIVPKSIADPLAGGLPTPT